jgi:hypothetical protein
MKRLFSLLISAAMIFGIAACNDQTSTVKETITFYKVPLVCGADSAIGCGSRLKPLFIETGNEKAIKESWSNRQGTVIAIVWNNNADEKIIQPLFKKQEIEAELISDSAIIRQQMASLKGNGKWYKGMDVDQLSIEEAGFIAESATNFAKEASLINENEAKNIKSDIEAYFKKELTQVRTPDNLQSDSTQGRWRQDAYQIYVNHIGKDRADKVSEAYEKYLSERSKCKESCCDKKETKS